MAFSEFEARRCELIVRRFIEKRRPPAHIRDKLDLGFRISGQSVEVFEIRPGWNDPSRKIEQPVAKVTYVKTQDVWKTYWQRADLRWHRYDPSPEAQSLEEALEVVDRDEPCCFFG